MKKGKEEERKIKNVCVNIQLDLQKDKRENHGMLRSEEEEESINCLLFHPHHYQGNRHHDHRHRSHRLYRQKPYRN